MSGRIFSLEPFTKAGFSSDLEITGRIDRCSNTLAISYLLRGRIEDLEIPAPADMPVRANALWEDTCFEFFVVVKNTDGYWEFNLSPAGHWNIYHFASYRQGMEEESAFGALPFKVLEKADSLSLDLAVDLNSIILANQPLDIAVSAVIKSKEGGMSYWALVHGAPNADFHRRDGFVLELS